jgi:hypothetical protein
MTFMNMSGCFVLCGCGVFLQFKLEYFLLNTDRTWSCIGHAAQTVFTETFHCRIYVCVCVFRHVENSTFI